MSNFEYFIHFSLFFTFWVEYFGFPSKSKVLSLTRNSRFKQRWSLFAKLNETKCHFFQKNFFSVESSMKIVPRIVVEIKQQSTPDFNNIQNKKHLYEIRHKKCVDFISLFLRMLVCMTNYLFLIEL